MDYGFFEPRRSDSAPFILSGIAKSNPAIACYRTRSLPRLHPARG